MVFFNISSEIIDIILGDNKNRCSDEMTIQIHKLLLIQAKTKTKNQKIKKNRKICTQNRVQH